MGYVKELSRETRILCPVLKLTGYFAFILNQPCFRQIKYLVRFRKQKKLKVRKQKYLFRHRLGLLKTSATSSQF